MRLLSRDASTLCLLAALGVAALGGAAGCNKEPKSEEPAGEASGAPAAEASGAAAPARPAPPPPRPPPAPTPALPPAPEPTGDRRELTSEEIYALRAIAGLAPPEPLRVGDLLTRADIRELTGYSELLAETTLDGIPPSPQYNAIRIATGDDYGVALQLWRPDEARMLTARFNRMRETWMVNTPDEEPAGDEAFFGEFGGIRHYVFMHRPSNSIGVVTCQFKLCEDPQVKAMATRVVSRL
jgi:hypothetical protein